MPSHATLKQPGSRSWYSLLGFLRTSCLLVTEVSPKSITNERPLGCLSSQCPFNVTKVFPCCHQSVLLLSHQSEMIPCLSIKWASACHLSVPWKIPKQLFSAALIDTFYEEYVGTYILACLDYELLSDCNWGILALLVFYSKVMTM